MTTAACSRCQAALAPDVLEGLCPRCLLEQALPLEPVAATTPAEADRPFTAPAPAELAPLFGQLEILQLLGQGGMGAVYKARQVKLDRPVALKVLPPAVAQDPTFAERFLREARALARLNHPHIVTVHDFGDVDGLYYLLMEFVDGVNLRQALAAGKLDPRQALAVVGELCSALQYAHDMGVVHRDIKPENVLLDRLGRVKVADFGLAKLLGQTQAAGQRLTGTRQAMGTLHYMAPEQWQKPAEVDHRADIYSLGVVFYELLTGELPLGKFALPSEAAGVDARLDGVVLRAIEKEPRQRYQHMSEMKTDVEKAGRPADGEDEPAPQAEPPRLNYALETLITAGMVALVGGVLGALGWAGQQKLDSVLTFLPWVCVGALFGVENRYLRRLASLGLLGALGCLLVGYVRSPDAPSGGGILFVVVGIFAAGMLIKSFRPGDGEEEGAEEEEQGEDAPVPGLTPQEEAVRRLLRLEMEEGSTPLSVLPEIDNTLLATARRECDVPPDDRILGIVDFGGGEAETALVFGCRGLYWCNGGDTGVPGADSLAYADMAGRRFVNQGDSVYLGSDQYVCPAPDESGVDCEVLTGLLCRVRDATAAGPAER